MSKRRIDVDGTLGPNAAKVAKPVLTPGMKMNPYTALPFTPRYFELFRKRIQVRGGGTLPLLPVLTLLLLLHSSVIISAVMRLIHTVCVRSVRVY